MLIKLHILWLNMLTWCNIRAAIPQAKLVFQGMDVMFHNGAPWDDFALWSRSMTPFFEDSFVYDFVYPFPKTHGLRQWFNGEHTAYNKAFGGYNSSVMMSVANRSALTSAAYHLARWSEAFAGVSAPVSKPVVRIRDWNLYAIHENRISYNWCMVDIVDIVQQGGYHVLPPAPLPEDGLFPPPNSMDGIPAPNSNFVNISHTKEAAKVFGRMIQEDFVAHEAMAMSWSAHMVWYGPAGIGTARGRSEYIHHVLGMMRESFSAPMLHWDGLVCEGLYCGAHFHLKVNHTGCWLGLPATGRIARLRFGMHARLSLEPSGYLVQEAWVQLDIPAAFSQLGVDLLSRARPGGEPVRGCILEKRIDKEATLQERADFGFLQASCIISAAFLLSISFLVHRAFLLRSLGSRRTAAFIPMLRETLEA